MPSRQDVSAKKSLQFPELYVTGQQDELFNYRIFSITFLHGVSTSLASFYIALWAFEDRVGSRAVGDYESFAVTVATSALLSVLMEVSTHVPFPMLAPGQMFRALGSPTRSPAASWLGDDLPWGRRGIRDCTEEGPCSCCVFCPRRSSWTPSSGRCCPF